MEIDSQQDRVGFTVKIFINLEEIDKFICAICKNVLRDAVQIPESNDPKRACLDCYKNNIRYVSSFMMNFFTEFCLLDQFPHLKKFCQLFEIMPGVLQNYREEISGRNKRKDLYCGIIIRLWEYAKLLEPYKRRSW